MQIPMANRATKSTDNTVFVRFKPPSLGRHQLEEFFSQVGPIKKCSVIRKTEQRLGYGFVKFLSKEDAEEAAKQYDGKTVEGDGVKYSLRVELASNDASNKVRNKREKDNQKFQKATVTDKKIQEDNKKKPEAANEKTPPRADDTLAKQKRTSRVIVRNLSFYANEKHIKNVLEKEFGPIIEITLPRVNENLHRGFCFVTFEQTADADKATKPRAKAIEIKKRPVAIDFSVSKVVHQRMKNEDNKDDEDDDDSNDEDDDDSNDEDEEESDDDDDDDDEEESDDEKGENDMDEKEEATSDDEKDDENENEPTPDKINSEEKEKKAPPTHDKGVEGQMTVFMRNLPFDTTRHDIFQMMHKFGYVETIFLVKDKETGVFRGSAFCKYAKAECAKRALEAANQDEGEFVSQRDGMSDEGGLQFRGRRIFMDLAVDKNTASTLAVEKETSKFAGKDKRNLYLKLEGRVESESDGKKLAGDAWEILPQSDQLKRQRAFTEKDTKLRSPLFFINPNRLSVRNLSKQIDEVLLKQLLVQATIRGLKKGLVKQEDQIAHWRAGGEMTTRDIMKKVTEAENSIIEDFSDRNVKQFIPSVYIDRDFTTNKKEKAPSRGFGFADFTHHAHALACLRELNNNTAYSSEFVAGGKKAMDMKKARRIKQLSKGDFVNEDGKVLVPRLIVDFVVENKAKARKQIENREKQQANSEKQRREQKEKKVVVKKTKKKKSRGAIQREKKRKNIEEGDDKSSEKNVQELEDKQEVKPRESMQVTKKVKPLKPKKKRKVDAEDDHFENLVKSYTETFSKSSKESTGTGENAAGKIQPSKTVEKRWFD